MRLLLVWAQLWGLFGACHCARALSLARVDFGGMVAIGTSRHLDDVQPLAASTDDDSALAMASVDQFRQTGVQFVHGGIVHGVDVHKWSEPGLQSFVPFPKDSRTGPDSLGKAQGESTRSRRVVYKFQRIQATAHGYFVAPSTGHCQARICATLQRRFIPKDSPNG